MDSTEKQENAQLSAQQVAVSPDILLTIANIEVLDVQKASTLFSSYGTKL